MSPGKAESELSCQSHSSFPDIGWQGAPSFTTRGDPRRGLRAGQYVRVLFARHRLAQPECLSIYLFPLFVLALVAQYLCQAVYARERVRMLFSQRQPASFGGLIISCLKILWTSCL